MKKKYYVFRYRNSDGDEMDPIAAEEIHANLDSELPEAQEAEAV